MGRKTAATTETVDPIDALPTVTISGAVSAVLSEAVEDHRWAARMSRADVVKEALTEWAEKRDLLDSARESLAAKLAEAQSA